MRGEAGWSEQARAVHVPIPIPLPIYSRYVLTAAVSFLDAVRQVVERQVHGWALGEVLERLRLSGHYLGLRLPGSAHGSQPVVVQQISIIVLSHLDGQSVRCVAFWCRKSKCNHSLECLCVYS